METYNNLSKVYVKVEKLPDEVFDKYPFEKNTSNKNFVGPTYIKSEKCVTGCKVFMKPLEYEMKTHINLSKVCVKVERLPDEVFDKYPFKKIPQTLKI